MAASIEIRLVEEKVLWFPTRIVIETSDIDDEDMLSIYTNLREQGGSLLLRGKAVLLSKQKVFLYLPYDAAP